MEESVKGEEEN